jgi:ABC-type transport system substrate-binding protein
MKNKSMFALAMLVIASMVLAACQPQTIIQTQIVEVTREVEVVETQVVEVTEIVEVERAAFTVPHPILSDLKVRQAMAHCTNKADLAKAGYPLLTTEEAQTLVMDTFIPTAHWAYAGAENVTQYPFDVAAGGALLDEAGWTQAEEGAVRTKEDGSVLALKFATTNAAFRQAWAAVWEAQMADCGIQILRSHVPASWWFGDTTGLQVRDFEVGAFAWVGQADPSGQTLWACDSIPLPSNNFAGQNYMGWCNEAADAAIKNANNTLDKDERIAQYLIVQQEYTKDVPAIPIFNRTETFSAVAALTGFAPTPGEEYYNYNVDEWAIPGKDTLVIGFTQEPASLFGLVESAFVANLAIHLIDFGLDQNNRTYTTLNYDYQPVLVKQMSTIENGLATNDDVEVTAGALVIDALGNPVELAAGVMVKDSTGAEVEYADGNVMMKQLTVTYELIDGLTWSDGTPVTQADVELFYKIGCDKESGATSYITCDNIESVEFNGLSYTVKWKPGNQSPTYFAAPITYYPAHRVIESAGPYQGMTLAEVPAKDWATLPEIAENPIGTGPYILTEWVKGEKMVFEPNPFYWKGAAATPNMVIAFLTPENAEAQLLTGAVDLLGSETLAGLSEQLVQAETDGKVNNYVIAGATWEHIDFNLFLK